MPELTRPYEIYEWQPGATEEWDVLDWEEGELEIQLRTREGTKLIDVLRIHLSPEQKPTFPHYWDLTSARLVAQLRPILGARGLGTVPVSITAIGAAPRTHFSVSRRATRPT